jgi:hypothetical protein
MKSLRRRLARQLAIKQLRKFAAAIKADDRFVTRLPTGKSHEDRGSQLREYFNAYADLLEANSQQDLKGQFAALAKLQQLDSSLVKDLPMDELKAALDGLDDYSSSSSQ